MKILKSSLGSRHFMAIFFTGGKQMQNVKFTKLAGIALLVALALSLGVGEKVVQAQTLFGLAHSGPNGLSTLYTIETTGATAGTETEVGPTGFERCSGMDFRAGTLFATCERASDNTHVLIIIDPESGIGAELRPTGVGRVSTGPFDFLAALKTASDISFRSDGVLHAHLRPFNSLWTISVTGGATTLIGETFVAGGGNGIAFSPGDVLFHANEANLNTLNQSSGNVTIVAGLDFPGPPVPAGPGCCDQPRINAMDFQPGKEPGTEILFASLNDRLLRGSGPNVNPLENFLATIDTETGVVTIKGQTVDGLDAIAFAPAAAAAGAELGDFKCYKVKRARGTPKLDKIEVTLNDSFDVINRETRVEKAETVCSPVGIGIGSTAPSTASLTCYKIKNVPEDPKFERLDVEVKNDLFVDGEGKPLTQALTLKKAKVLCVPSMIVP